MWSTAIRFTWIIAKKAVRKFFADNGVLLASALAFDLLLYSIPLSLLLISALGYTVVGSARAFRPGKSGIGYYFIRPGAKPRIEYDVMSDVDILDVAAQYFGKPDLATPR